MSSGWHFWRFGGVPLDPILAAFWSTFLEACLNLYVNRDMHENTSIYYGLAMSEPLENWLFWTFWGTCFDAFGDRCFGKASGPHFGDLGPLLGSLLTTILGTFEVPFLYQFSESFQDSPKVKAGLEWRLISSISGVQKQVYINKISRSTDGYQLTCRHQLS